MFHRIECLCFFCWCYEFIFICIQGDWPYYFDRRIWLFVKKHWTYTSRIDKADKPADFSIAVADYAFYQCLWHR